jgi:hypothetical protein
MRSNPNIQELFTMLVERVINTRKTNSSKRSAELGRAPPHNLAASS